MKPALACLLATVSLTGCGGDDEELFTRENVQATMTEGIREQLPEGATIDQLECVQDGDQLHWRCLTYALRGDQRYQVTVQVTCDERSEQCLTEPARISPLP